MWYDVSMHIPGFELKIKKIHGGLDRILALCEIAETAVSLSVGDGLFGNIHLFIGPLRGCQYDGLISGPVAGPR